MHSDYAQSAESAVTRTAVPELLARRSAVILERIAGGGGETCWYYCEEYRQLSSITSRFRPGSLVSFYFDDRIQRARYSSDLLPLLESMLSMAPEVVGAREIVVGVLGPDGVAIDVEFPSSVREIEEQLSESEPAAIVFFGHFPARDDDGRSAVTIHLPDRDGVVRAHPY